MTLIVAIDPGDVHVGFAAFNDELCLWADETSPQGLVDYLIEELPYIDTLVVERFQLYPHLAAKQHGSDMLTSQLIGAIRVLAYQAEVPVVIQQAALKRPTESLINHRDISRMSFGKGNHAKDAETHGYAYLWRRDDRG